MTWCLVTVCVCVCVCLVACASRCCGWERLYKMTVDGCCAGAVKGALYRPRDRFPRPWYTVMHFVRCMHRPHASLSL